ncbi:cupin domain-containing protein [Actimicrobium antarcticum]|uniref:Cupin domain-containing protein n=1 Tax=Actimicrobium antarcticum TaxID=1051899 RepID=A0ABP7TZ94_9BURK
MELNANFTRRTLIHAAQLPWIASPVAGIERRMLDRIGDEVARATSIVRYAPGSQFTAHVHGGGEEFLVLDGVFSDEHGDCPAGTYVRNPPTSHHTPGSRAGCTIFVKLWQFDPADRTPVRIASSERAYVPAPGQPGVEWLPLFRDQREEVRLERWAAGAEIVLACTAPLELLVLDGDFAECGDVLVAQSWLRLPAGASLRARVGPHGCRVWIKSGRFADAFIVPA